MTSCLSDSLSVVLVRHVFTLLLLSGSAVAQSPASAPAPLAAPRLESSVALPSTRAAEPAAEAKAYKVRLHGEYELRQSFLTALPLRPYADGPAHLEQTTRLYHRLRLRSLALLDRSWEVRGEIDVPHGMIYGQRLEGVPENGSDFGRPQPVRVTPRMLRVTGRSRWGELSFGHTTLHRGLGVVDHDGDRPAFFGTPERASTYERVELQSGDAASTLRVGLAGGLAFEQGALSLWDGDRKWQLELFASFSPDRRAHFGLLARYEALSARGSAPARQSVLLDAMGAFRSALPGRSGELFAEYEAAYRVADVSGPRVYAQAPGEHLLSALAGAARLGFALERTQGRTRFAPLVISLAWGLASGDPDPTDEEEHRFVMNPNHRVGSLLFGEILRFKSSRALAQLPGALATRDEELATRGGVAGATYLNPVLLIRPSAELTLKLGAVVASATTDVVDPAALAATGQRQNFDGGPARGRSLGRELDAGAQLAVELDPPMQLRLSLEGALAWPGSAFDDGEGRALGTQALTTAGLGLTF